VSLSTGPLRDALLAHADLFPDVEISVVDESRRSLMERLNNGALDIIMSLSSAFISWNANTSRSAQTSHVSASMICQLRAAV
jgi:hypothetical protein